MTNLNICGAIVPVGTVDDALEYLRNISVDLADFLKENIMLSEHDNTEFSEIIDQLDDAKSDKELLEQKIDYLECEIEQLRKELEYAEEK